jgi:hypothetical protein
MRKFAAALYAAALLAGSTGSLALAQTAVAKPAEDTAAAKPAATTTREMHCAEETSGPPQTFYIDNATQQSEANEIVAALRNILDPCDKIYLVQSQDAIVVRAGAENMALAQKLLRDLDRSRKTYRLTYTVTEMDGTKKIGSQRFAMVLTSGQETSLKLGNKFPIVTEAATPPLQTQFTYIDIGMNFDATLTEMGQNAMLKSSVEDTSVAPEKSDIAGVQEPIVRQATLKGESLLAPGKPLMLGSVDIPGSTGHLDVEVVMEPLP